VDPLKTVWDALEARDCNPRGPEHRFSALCPAHEDRSPSLTVAEGSDGRAVLLCRTGCDTAEVVAALGLRWADLFAEDSPEFASRRRGTAPPLPPIDRVLKALRVKGLGYRCHPTEPDWWTVEHCWVCGYHRVWLYADERGRVSVACFEGCSQERMLSALGAP